MKERTLWLPIFLLLLFDGEEGKEKQDRNIDFGEEFGAYHTLVQEARASTGRWRILLQVRIFKFVDLGVV